MFPRLRLTATLALAVSFSVRIAALCDLCRVYINDNGVTRYLTQQQQQDGYLRCGYNFPPASGEGPFCVYYMQDGDLVFADVAECPATSC
ncbi:hypothetical protein B0H17DRAFT_1204866 [Mycena rosella]|uniref:Uncharacterized protein n=1 Tax=Mycena rosella TaxID=1033263 RepID=A0AAD7GDD5_MYCRO|nr:hypothetical protein B0H17DRAFT_1204866 [Mycena rosella]